MSASPLATGQDLASQRPPIIHLNLPPEIPSDVAQISYFMTGPFGGYGSFVKAEKDKSTYDIIAAVDGRPAVNVKLIAYLPGCQIETFDIPVQSETTSQQLRCFPLAQIILNGQIETADMINSPSEVEVTYLAMWDHRFFGIADGLVTTIRVATAIPDQNGHFEVTVPDFNAQANLGEGEFQFTLREIKTRNIIAFLRPTDEPRGSQGLRVQASYPLIRFSVARTPSRPGSVPRP